MPLLRTKKLALEHKRRGSVKGGTASCEAMRSSLPLATLSHRLLRPCRTIQRIQRLALPRQTAATNSEVFSASLDRYVDRFKLLKRMLRETHYSLRASPNTSCRNLDRLPPCSCPAATTSRAKRMKTSALDQHHASNNSLGQGRNT